MSTITVHSKDYGQDPLKVKPTVARKFSWCCVIVTWWYPPLLGCTRIRGKSEGFLAAVVTMYRWTAVSCFLSCRWPPQGIWIELPKPRFDLGTRLFPTLFPVRLMHFVLPVSPSIIGAKVYHSLSHVFCYSSLASKKIEFLNKILVQPLVCFRRSLNNIAP